jgi:hypothetical protein
MQFDFEKTMSETSDEELIRIITVDRTKYQPAALEAADKEFKKRKLPEETFEELKAGYEDQQRIDDFKANMPLEPVMKVIAFLFAGALFWIIGSSWAQDGYERKANEFRKWAFFGFLFYILLALFFNLQR